MNMFSGKTKHKLYIGVIIILFVLLIDAPLVSAAGLYESDAVDDICHIFRKDGKVERICNQSQPSIDIFKVARNFVNDTNTLDLKIVISGQVSIDENTYYKVWYNTSVNNNVYRYVMNYSNGENNGWIEDPYGNKTYLEGNPVVSTNKHIITVSYPIVNVSYNENIEGLAVKKDESGTWVDRLKNTDDIKTKPYNGSTPSDNTSGSDFTGGDDNSTPGFPFFAIVFGIICMLIFYKRKKQK